MAYLNYDREQLTALFEWYGNKCLVCGSTKVTIDHVIPTSCNGLDVLENIQPLCQCCNSTKGKKTIDYRPKPYPYAPFITDPVIAGYKCVMVRLRNDLYEQAEQVGIAEDRSVANLMIYAVRKLIEEREREQQTAPQNG